MNDFFSLPFRFLPSFEFLFPPPVTLAAALPLDFYWTAFVLLLCLGGWLAALRSEWRHAAAWGALALAGQACSLQLLSAGPLIQLQVFHRWGDLLGSFRAFFFVGVLLQGILVLWGARRLWPAIRTGLPGLLSGPKALLFLALVAYGALTIHVEFVQAFLVGGLKSQIILLFTRFSLALFLLAINTLNLVLAAAAIPAGAFDTLGARWQRSDRRSLPWLAALWVVTISSLLSWLVFERLPHVPDEVCYLFQAKYLSLGHLWLPVPPDPESLYVQFYLAEGGKWYGSPPAGWPMVLAVGVWAAVPWLVNPLLGGMAILLAHALLKQLYDRNVADGAVLLLAASPWLLFLSASLMTHPLTLLFSLAALLGVARARETAHLGWSALAGLGCGALLHVRPLEAVIVAAVGGVWWLGIGWRNLRLRGPAMATAAGLAMTALLLAYNLALTGNALQMPLNRFIDQHVYEGANRLGFGRNVGTFGWTQIDALSGHGPIDVLMNNNHNLYMASFELFGWSCGSLLFVYLLLVSASLRRHALLWGLVFSTVAGMSLYWYSGVPDFGARYWYQMILPLAALTILGAQDWAAQLREMGHSAANSQRAWGFIALCSLGALLTVVPWRSLDKYPNYRGVRSDFRRLEATFGRSLVFVRCKLPSDYSAAFAFNPPGFERDAPGPIYARIVSPESVARVRAYYSDRPVWIVLGASLAGGAAQVIAGPIPPGAPLPQEKITPP